MDWQAIWLSLKLATCTTLVLGILGLPVAYWLASSRWHWKFMVEAVVALPLVLPPTVLGFYVLLALGPASPMGRAYESLTGGMLPFSFSGLLIASVLYSLPFAVRPFAVAFASVEHRLVEASWCLGVSRFGTFFRVVVPLSWTGILTGLILTFAHTLGEFGVVLMVGGNIPGQTRHSVHLHLRRSAVPELRRGGENGPASGGLLFRGAGIDIRSATANGCPMTALEADFEKRFPAGPAIHGLLRLPAGAPSVTVLFGPSGSGKTTVLRCLAGLERPERGSIRFGEQTWFDAARGICLPPGRRGVGYLSQDFALFPHLSLTGNVAYGLGALGTAKRRHRVGEMLDLFGLTGMENRYPSQLSGGEQQRVALARGAGACAALLLLDEPLSALDSPTRELLRRQLRHWLAALGVPTLLVTHDRVEALALGDSLVIVDRGRVLQAGPAADVFARPACLAAARIVGVETIEPARVLEVNGDLASVTVGGLRLFARTRDVGIGDAHVCIRAEDVILEKGRHPAGTSNCLPGLVQEIVWEGPMTRVFLDCGFSLVALLTHHAIRELGLRVGEQINALVKTEDVHLVLQDGRAGDESPRK